MELTPLEALARHRERFGYNLLYELQNICKYVMRLLPPSTCKVILPTSGSSSSPTLDDSATSANQMCDTADVVTANEVARSPAAQAFLCDLGFLRFEIDGEACLLLSTLPVDGTKERDAFMQEWADALRRLRWAAECNTSLISIEYSRLVVMQSLTGDYRIRVTVSWSDEIGAKKQREYTTPYRDADHVGVVNVANVVLAKDRHVSGTLDLDHSSADDSYDGSDDGLHAATASSTSSNASPERHAASRDTDEGVTASTEDETSRGLFQTFASWVSRVREDSGASSADGTGAASWYRYLDTAPCSLDTECDRACDVLFEVLKRRPLIMDKVIASGSTHYRNFGSSKFELDLRDPERPFGLPSGRVTLRMTSLSHRCFDVEERAREMTRRPMTLEEQRDAWEREAVARSVRRMNSQDEDAHRSLPMTDQNVSGPDDVVLVGRVVDAATTKDTSTADAHGVPCTSLQEDTAAVNASPSGQTARVCVELRALPLSESDRLFDADDYFS